MRNPASKSLQSTELSLFLALTNELNIDERLILLKNTILLMKSQLVTSYTLKHDVNRMLTKHFRSELFDDSGS
jgi:hypothetical protein